MGHATPKAIISRYFAEVWHQRRLDLINQFVAPTAISYERHGPDVQGQIGIHQAAASFFARFPNAQFTILDIVAEDNTVVAHLSIQATHAETGRAIAITGMNLFRLANDQIIESWSNWDELGLFQQLGGKITFES